MQYLDKNTAPLKFHYFLRIFIAIGTANSIFLNAFAYSLQFSQWQSNSLAMQIYLLIELVCVVADIALCAVYFIKVWSWQPLSIRCLIAALYLRCGYAVTGRIFVYLFGELPYGPLLFAIISLFQIGYSVAFAIIVHLYYRKRRMLFDGKKPVRPSAIPALPAPTYVAADFSGYRFCTKCGCPMGSKDKFCSRCGSAYLPPLEID